MLATLRKLFLSLLLLACATLSFAAENADVKSLFDRYQSVYKQYREAVQSGADQQTISALSKDLKSACADYYKSIGVEVTPDSLDESNLEPQEDFSESPSESTATSTNFSSVRRKANIYAEELNKILADLSSPDAEKKSDELIKRLQDFADKCPDPEIKKQAIFQLATLVFDKSGSLSKAQRVILNFVKTTRLDKESKRQSFAVINMLKKKAVLIEKRSTFKEVQQNAINKWGSFSKSSWLAIPVKVWKLGSYLTTNLNRSFKARALDKALEEYDKAVLATYPKGSVEELTRSRIVPLNRVRMLVNGRTSFHYRFEHAKRAQ